MSISASISPKKFTYEFLSTHRVAALATVDTNNYPDTVPVFCVVDKDLNLYFTSRVEGRKFINITTNPRVALSFAHENKLEAILVRGYAERVNQLDLEQLIIRSLMIDKQHEKMRSLPSMQLYESGHTNEVAIVKVIPTELTYADFSQDDNQNVRPFFQKII